MTEPLSLHVSLVSEEPSWLPIPSMGRPDAVIPGAMSYRVDLVAHVHSREEYERWRSLVGKYLYLQEVE